MVDSWNDHLSIRVQCRLLSISRSGGHYDPKGEAPLNLKLMRLIDEQFLSTPHYGSRQIFAQGWLLPWASPCAAFNEAHGFTRD